MPITKEKKMVKKILISFLIVSMFVIFMERKSFTDPNLELWKISSFSDQNVYRNIKVSFLLWNGAEPMNPSGPNGATAIQTAIYSQNIELVSRLSKEMTVKERKLIYDENAKKTWDERYLMSLKKILLD